MNEQRATALRARREMHPDDRARSSETICERVIRSSHFLASNTIACYLPTFDEVDTSTIVERAWRANKRIFVPVLRTNRKMSFREVHPDSVLLRNKYGVWEPTAGDFVSARELDTVIAPTVAYDDNNNRIGMGGGYFDRCFAFLRHRKHWFRPKLIGIAFACQKIEKISPNTWDVQLYRVFTEAT